MDLRIWDLHRVSRTRRFVASGPRNLAAMTERGKPRKPRSSSARAGGGRSGSGANRSPDRSGERKGERKGGSKPERPGRDRANEGGFGPHGAPTVPDRVKRPDDPERERRPAPLRVRGQQPGAKPERTPRRTQKAGTSKPGEPRRRRARPPSDVETEVLRLGGRRGPYLLREVMAAADAYAGLRDREALRHLRPVRDALPDAPSVRELTGLAQYRIGNYRAAATELQAFVELTDSVEQHPVLMDCYRAQRRWGRVDELWEELAAASPSVELMTEGRIVAAGALADRRQLTEAIALLEKKAGPVRNPRDSHLRLWYALADLEERAGNNARARALFDRIHDHDRDFADVEHRRKALR
jgi:hypothetical protein